jgi:MFS family permease
LKGGRALFEDVAGLAVLAAIYPPAMLVAALYLGSGRPGKTTAFYVAGGFLVVAVVGTAALVAIRAGGLSLPSHHQTRYGLRLGLGIVALLAAVLIYRRKPKPKKPAGTGKEKKPGLMERLAADPKPRTAFVVGILMFGPSVTFIAAVQVVASSKADVVSTVGAMVMIFVLAIAFAWLPLVAYLIAPGHTTRTLKAFENWLRLHRRKILSAAVGVIGVLLLAQGIAGLV